MSIKLRTEIRPLHNRNRSAQKNEHDIASNSYDAGFLNSKSYPQALYGFQAYMNLLFQFLCMKKKIPVREILITHFLQH